MSTWILVFGLIVTGEFMTTGDEYPNKAICEADAKDMREQFNRAHPTEPVATQCVLKVR